MTNVKLLLKRFIKLDFIIALIIAFPYLYIVITNEYLPVTDEVYQFNATLNLIAGHGYSSSMEFGEDLSEIIYKFMTAWPRGYSLLIAFVMNFGFEINVAAKLIKLTFIIVSIINWLSLSKLALFEQSFKIIFAAFLGFYVVAVSTSVPDLIVFSIFPYFILKIIIMIEIKPRNYANNRINNFIFLGLLAGISVWFKYTALPILLIGSLVLMINYKDERRLELLIKILEFSIPATVMICVLFIINYLNAREFSTITTVGLPKEIIFFKFTWLISLFDGLLVDAFILPKIIFRYLGNVIGNEFSTIIKTTYIIFMSLMILLFSFNDDKKNIIKMISKISLISVILFLLTTSILFYSNTEYNPLQHGRYYHFIIPLIMLVIIMELSKNSIIISKNFNFILTILTVVTNLICSTFFALYLNNIFRSEQVGSELAKVQVSKIKEQTSPEVVIVFAEGDSFHSSPWKGVYPLYPRLPTNKELNFSKKTLVILICGIDSSRNGIIEKNGCEESGFFSLAKLEGFNEYRLNQQKILFWRIFEKNIHYSI